MSVTDPAYMPRTQDVRRRFDRAAPRFDDADFVHRLSRDGLMSRLAPMAVDASTVLDLGAATSAATPALAQRFRGAKIVSVDLSLSMLEHGRRRRRGLLIRRRTAAVQADARALPFADDSADVVFANMLLPWIGDPAQVFGEVARVLRDGGLFAFATLGPDSLLGVRRAWQAASPHAHVNHFLDMHDIGDAVVRSGLADPVLDVDRLAVSYRDAKSLFRDLTAAGARNSLTGRAAGLTGKHRFTTMRDALFADGQLKLELELVYGHCFGRSLQQTVGEVRIDAGSIPRRSR